jgi:hypothetical protein
LASDLRAASTAQLSDQRCGIALVRHEEGDPLLWLELDSEDDVDRIRRALGVGHAGFGQLRWPPRRGVFHNRATAADMLASLGWLAIIAAVCLGETEVALGLLLPVVPLTLVAMVLATAANPGRQVLALTPQGIDALVDGEAVHLPWSRVVDVETSGDALVIRTAEGDKRIRMRSALANEREHVAAQVRSAARRSRGEGPLPPEISPSLAILSPRDEGKREWLERIEGTAAAMAHGEGYRHVGVEPRDLWSALESPDTPAPVRAAAARILARIAPEEAGERIARALAMEHDADTRRRIRVALEEDLDVAAHELELLDHVWPRPG